MLNKPSKKMEAFDNPFPNRDYRIHMEIPEFTCLCPKTGQPDFARLILDYIPDKKCIELKSLKLYIWSFRDQGVFHETVTNQILDDFVAACDPLSATVKGDFTPRGNVHTVIEVHHQKS